MKTRKIFLVMSIAATALPVLSGCAAKAFEREINVVFMNEGKVVDSGTVTQFKNIQSPTISSAYIPTDFKFLGWTCYDTSELDYSDATHFKTQYIGGGRMVHYSDVAKFADSDTVICNALIMYKDDIPKEYHYAVVAWYDKAATSGLSSDIIDPYESMVKSYLVSSGVSQADADTVLFRSYSGNVGPTTGQILYDDDVDIMLGWGSLSNITTTGSIPEESVLQSDSITITYNGEDKNRWVHRLTDSDGSIAVYNYILSDESTSYFKK